LRPNPAELPLSAAPGTLLFDLDGTLVDSLPDLTHALNAVLAEAGLPPAGLELSRRYVGDGARLMLERGFQAHGRAAPADGVARFLEVYETCLTRETRPFPGTVETLARLAEAGWRLAVCTNKTERHSRMILRALGLLPLFQAVAGGDSYPERKPDGRHLTRTLAAMGAPARGAIMVGDSLNDVLAARDAGLPVVVVGFGYGEPAALAADRLIQRMDELPDCVAALATAR
jgi:phosphoglycolate phosphatase